MKRKPATPRTREQRSLERLSIGQVARLSGISAKAIRYYEQAGVLPPVPRQANGYRSYSQLDVNCLILLRCFRVLGIPLESLKPLLLEASDARCADIQQETIQLVAQRMQAIDQEIKDLQRLREQLACHYRQLEACHPNHRDGQQPFRTCRVSCLPLQEASGGEEASPR